MSRILTNSLDVTPVSWRPAVQKVQPVSLPANIAVTADETSSLHSRIAELECQLEQQSTESWDNGFRAGEEAVRQKVAGESRAETETVAKTIAELATARASMIRRAEGDTVRLSVEIARRVLHRELSIDPFAMESLIKAALQKLQAQEIYKVRVHPDEEKVMRACLEQMDRHKGIEISSDPILPKGGVVFEISSGSLDASVETQLKEIERGLADHLELRS